MRYAYAGTPRWSRYDIGDAERDQLATQTVAMAAALGFDIPAASIRGVKLMERADALCVELDGDGTTGSAGRHYLEHPMQDREGPADPVVLRPEAAHRLITFLHEQRWRQERRRAIAGLTKVQMPEHQDGDTLTRWARAMALHDPSRIGRPQTLPIQFREFEHNCRATLTTDGGKVRIEAETIALPFTIPEVFGGLITRALGDVVQFPTCGDAALDAEIARLMILEIETVAATPARRAHTMFKVFTQQQLPLVAGTDSRWRRLRSVRPLMTGRAPDYLQPDLEMGAATYHAECDALLGETTALPVRLEMAMAP